mmetsp:Transcript_16253/g.18635  ORF Transcript_16253/g.18635 Transcript_16253/m.18635 type:complete len:145 (+) Transcript_16253:68-502(+)
MPSGRKNPGREHEKGDRPSSNNDGFVAGVALGGLVIGGLLCGVSLLKSWWLSDTASPQSATAENRSGVASVASSEKGNEKKVAAAFDDTTGSSATTCCVCLERQANCLFKPCLHLKCCMECSRRLTECPLCRSQIAKMVGPVYL